MSNKNDCPYCGSENFENVAKKETETTWLNKCRGGCGLYSLFDELLDEQVELPEERRING